LSDIQILGGFTKIYLYKNIFLIKNQDAPSKKKYTKPKLKKLGSVNNLTLKTGSLSDFGGNKYTP
jgi:hypothetical protein